MSISAFNIKQKPFTLKKKSIITLLILVTTCLTILLYKYVGRFNLLIYSSIAAFIILQILNFKTTYIIYVITFFLNFILFDFYIAVLFSLIILISFVVTQKFELKEFKNPLTLPILFYLLCCIPSFIYNYSVEKSVYTSLNFLAFLIVFYATTVYFNNYKKYYLPLITFLILSCINAFVVIIQVFLTHKRLFGFTGLMFVDFVHLAILIALANVLYKQGFIKFLNVIIILLLSVSSVMMQTRNAWIAFVATILTFIPYILIKSPKFGLKEK